MCDGKVQPLHISETFISNLDQGEHMTEEKTKKGKRALVDTNIERAENARFSYYISYVILGICT